MNDTTKTPTATSNTTTPANATATEAKARNVAIDFVPPTLRPADALAHLNEVLASLVDQFERDYGLRLATVKVKRDKEADTLLTLTAHVR